MTTIPERVRPQAIEYPERDGKPMADNTEQFEWIVLIKENLEAMFRDQPEVFVAGDLLWYPVEGNNRRRAAPDAMVVFGRPKGKRGSYKQWEEGGIAPQVVFEVLSPGNTRREQEGKFAFYEAYGVEEYYVYDPERNWLEGWQRRDERLMPIGELNGWVSPRLGIRLVVGRTRLELYRPDGQPFISFSEQQRQAEAERAARLAAEAELARLRQRLRELGLEDTA